MAKFETPRTAMEQWDANIRAITTLKELERTGAEPTKAQQETLAKFSGFGNSAFEQAFQPNTHDWRWRNLGDELRRITTKQEYDSIIQSRLNAHYTTPAVIEGVWAGLQSMNTLGKGSGPGGTLKVLEPSAGSGRFIGLGPASLIDESSVTAVEKDDLTGRILRAAYPQADVHIGGFEEAPIPDDSQDVAISNVPFGGFGVHDPKYLDEPHVTNRIHNYFFVKALDKLRPGGVVAFITTHGTLDTPAAKKVRQTIAERADFLGAVRLPQDAFPDTDVVTDVIYLRKRLPGEEPGDRSWVDTVKVELVNKDGKEQKYDVNKWMVEHPDAVLGKESGQGSMYGGNEYTVSAKGVYGSAADVAEALTNQSRDIGRGHRFQVVRTAAYDNERPRSERPVGQYFYNDKSDLMVVDEDGQEIKPHFSNKKQRERIEGMMHLRDQARTLMSAERGQGNWTEDSIADLRKRLRDTYEEFVGDFGPLNVSANASLFRRDPDSAFVAGLERKKGDDWIPTDIFERRVLGATPAPTLSSIDDAYNYYYARTGRVDMAEIGELVGADAEAVTRYLDDQNLAYFDAPTATWQSRSDFLTGDVRDKLENTRSSLLLAQADAASPDTIDAGAHPWRRDPDSLRRIQESLTALEAAQPEPIPASDIRATLGASWIPAEYLNDWIAEKFNTYYGDRFYNYDFERGRWVNEQKISAPPEMMQTEWGTRKAPAPKILDAVLDGKPVVVTDKVDDREVVDEAATAEAQQRAEKMQDDFERWVWEEDDRRERLAAHYNATYNTSVPRTYDGGHQTFPGMSEGWQQKLRPHQRDAIYRVVSDGTALLAHEVGFGKTAVMVAGGMERKRLGLANKPMYVVPKATHAQFKEQFQELYPDAKILYLPDFSKGQREQFLTRAQTGDWDALIVSYEQFKSIPVRPSTEIAFREEQVKAMMDAKRAADREGRRETSKDLGKAIESERKKLADLQAKIAKRQDSGGYFEDLGVDQLFVDEADNFKNLQFTTSMRGRGTGIKGLPDSKSQRAFDMFMKAQYLQGNIPGTDIADETRKGHAKQGVVFATGTPIANTIAEMWTMMRYLDLKNLRKRKLHNFDTWAKSFGRVKTDIEVNAAGRYVPTARFSKFKNAPELSKLFQDTADVRVASEVPEMLEAQPRLRDEGGRPQRITVAAPASASQDRYREYIGDRADAIKGGEPFEMVSSMTGDAIEDNMLKLSTDARKAALDIRMVDNWPFDETPVPNPQGKIQMAAENAARVYHEETPDKGTQLIFLDLATPKAGSGRDTGEDTGDKVESGEDLLGREQEMVRDAYNIIKRELVSKGVPEKQIAFIHDYNTKPKQTKLFDQVNAGDVRIVIGSTSKLGVGVNVQERAAALHHIDVPWRPRDVEQREGRIIRQGNLVYGPKIDKDTGDVFDPGKGVQIYTYVQEGSFDEFMWQAVEEKAQSIKGIVKRNVTERELDDIDPLVLSASEAKALASGDARVLKLANLNKKLIGLRLKERAHQQSQLNLASQRRETEKRVEALQNRVPKLEADRDRAAQLLDAEFAMTVGNRSYDKTADANKALLAALDKLAYKGSWKELGSYGPFAIEGANLDTGHRIALVGPDGTAYQTDDIKNLDGANAVTRARNVLTGIDAAAEDARRKLDQNLKSQDYYRKQESLPFDLFDELQDAEREFAELQAEITGTEVSAPPAVAPVMIAAQSLDEYDVETATDEEWQAASDAVAAELVERMRTERGFSFPTKEEQDSLIADRLRKDYERQRRAEIEAMPPPVVDADDDGVITQGEVVEAIADKITEELNDGDRGDVVVVTDADIERAMDDVESEQSAEAVHEEVGEDVGNAIAERPGVPVVVEDADVPDNVGISVKEGPDGVVKVGGYPDFVDAVFDELESEEVPTVIREDMADGVVETAPNRSVWEELRESDIRIGVDDADDNEFDHEAELGIHGELDPRTREDFISAGYGGSYLLDVATQPTEPPAETEDAGFTYNVNTPEAHVRLIEEIVDINDGIQRRRGHLNEDELAALKDRLRSSYEVITTRGLEQTLAKKRAERDGQLADGGMAEVADAMSTAEATVADRTEAVDDAMAETEVRVVDAADFSQENMAAADASAEDVRQRVIELVLTDQPYQNAERQGDAQNAAVERNAAIRRALERIIINVQQDRDAALMASRIQEQMKDADYAEQLHQDIKVRVIRPTSAAYSDSIKGMAERMTAGERLKRGSLNTVTQQRLLSSLIHENPELAEHLGISFNNYGMPLLTWNRLSRPDAVKLIEIFQQADEYATPAPPDVADVPPSELTLSIKEQADRERARYGGSLLPLTDIEGISDEELAQRWRSGEAARRHDEAADAALEARYQSDISEAKDRAQEAQPVAKRGKSTIWQGGEIVRDRLVINAPVEVGDFVVTAKGEVFRRTDYGWDDIGLGKLAKAIKDKVPAPLPFQQSPEPDEPYFYRETDVETGDTVIHVEADTPQEAAEIVAEIAPEATAAQSANAIALPDAWRSDFEETRDVLATETFGPDDWEDISEYMDTVLAGRGELEGTEVLAWADRWAASKDRNAGQAAATLVIAIDADLNPSRPTPMPEPPPAVVEPTPVADPLPTPVDMDGDGDADAIVEVATPAPLQLPERPPAPEPPPLSDTVRRDLEESLEMLDTESFEGKEGWADLRDYIKELQAGRDDLEGTEALAWADRWASTARRPGDRDTDEVVSELRDALQVSLGMKPRAVPGGLRDALDTIAKGGRGPKGKGGRRRPPKQKERDWAEEAAAASVTVKPPPTLLVK